MNAGILASHFWYNFTSFFRYQPGSAFLSPGFCTTAGNPDLYFEMLFLLIYHSAPLFTSTQYSDVRLKPQQLIILNNFLNLSVTSWAKQLLSRQKSNDTWLPNLLLIHLIIAAAAWYHLQCDTFAMSTFKSCKLPSEWFNSEQQNHYVNIIIIIIDIF